MKQEYIDRIIKAGNALDGVNCSTSQVEIERIKDEIFCAFLDMYHYYKNNPQTEIKNKIGELKK